MTLNILEEDVQGIFSKNPLRTQREFPQQWQMLH